MEIFETFKSVVERRRSIRIFDDTEIPESVVRECLEMALLAPTSSNLQCWEFYWVREPEKKKRLIKACMSQSTARTARELIVAVARTDTWRENNRRLREIYNNAPWANESVKKYYNYLVPAVYGVGPFGLLGKIKFLGTWIASLFRPMVLVPSGRGALRLWAEKTTALACENLMLAFAAAGFDTCPMEGFDDRRVRKLLNLPRHASVVMVISAGRRHPKASVPPRVRLPSNLFIKEI